MSTRKQLRLGAFMRPVSIHTGAWRYPGAWPDANFNFERLKQLAQTLERGRFDAFFMADHLALLNMPIEALQRSHTATSFEPFTLLSALAQHTQHLGLIATASTTFDEPFHIARRFASLDHLSGGRAGWNIVTTSNPDAALNFGREDHMEHDARYDRAREFHDVVTGLWDSWEDDSFVRDKDSGQYFHEDKLHVLHHKGKHFSVRGPLNVSRSPQGRPVVVQAGASEAGRDLAARTAEVIFVAHQTFDEAKSFYRDIKDRAQAYDREPESIKIMPGIFPVVGRTQEEAEEKFALLQDLVHPVVGVSLLSNVIGGFDFSGLPVDGPVPELPETNGPKSRQRLLLDLARRENLSIRDLYLRIAGARGHQQVVGTPQSIADQLQQWFEEGGADGFNIMSPWFPGGLQDFIELVLPELRRRGLVRTEYDGSTLREHLGLQRPRHGQRRAAVSAA